MYNSSPINIVHVGRYHHKDDIRIFYKECQTLAHNGYQVSYITSDIYGDTENYEVNGIQIYIYHNENLDWGIRKDILKRIFFRRGWINDIVNFILSLQPDVVHIHEYQALFIIKPLLKRNAKIKIVYDIHEDNPRQLTVHYRKKWGKYIAKLVEKYIEQKEKKMVKNADLVLCATDYLSNLFSRYNNCTFTVKNYPKTDDIYCNNSDLKERLNNYCYSGGITDDRGITLIIKNSDSIKGKFIIAGNIDKNYEKYLIENYSDIIERNVEYKGYITRKQINNLYSTCVVGLCTLHYHPNYINALPIKLFEYMAAGIPVICSDFPLWRKIVEDANCGITVNPNDEKEIINAINYLLTNRDMAKQMGDNGKEKIKEKYSWEREEKILLKAYGSIL